MENRTIKEVDDYMGKTSAEFQEILATLRRIVLESHPDLIEEYKWSMPNYSAGGLVIYLQATKNHVKLGFHKGNELEEHDHSNLLTNSTAKTMRHIKITDIKQVNPEAFTFLIKKAVDLNKK